MCTCLKYVNSTEKDYIKNLLKQYKKEDIKKEQYDPNNFIDFCFVKMQYDTDNSDCYICLKPLKLDSVKIYKLDDNKGYIKSNCFLICPDH